jgi:hypothetical protein
MSKPYSHKGHQGFVFNNGHKISRDELKHINAQLAGLDVEPPARLRPPVLDSILPKGWLRRRAEADQPPQIREDRLELLHTLGEYMLQPAAETQI